MSDLSGRVALVTGASRRLGAAIAAGLAGCGARLIVNYNTSRADAEALVARLAAAGSEAIAVPGDVADPAAVAGLVQAALDAWGRLDIVVHNAGPYSDVPFTQLPVETWDWIVNTNVRAAYLAAQAAAPAMRANGWGRLVHIAAGSARVRNHAVYGLAKSALVTLTEALALELAPEVTVNAIAPGLVDDDEVPAAVRAQMLADTPLRRLVTPGEVAGMVQLLCSPAFATVTGQTIVMDGGQTIPRGLVPTAE